MKRIDVIHDVKEKLLSVWENFDSGYEYLDDCRCPQRLWRSWKKSEEYSEKRTLVIATSPDFPPFAYLEGGDVVSIEVDILEKIAKNLGVTRKSTFLRCINLLEKPDKGKILLDGVDLADKHINLN